MSLAATRLVRTVFLLVAGAASLELVAALSDLAPPRAGSVRLCPTRGNDELLSDASLFRFHPRWMWEPRPNARNAGSSVDEILYRGPAQTLAPGAALRIAVIGGSFAWGVGVKPRQAWPALLRRELRAPGLDVGVLDLEVLDFSVLDFSVLQGERYYAERVRPWRPDVVIACFGGLHESETAPGGICDSERMERAEARGGPEEPFFERFAAARCIAAALRPVAPIPAPQHTSLFGREVRVVPARYYEAMQRLAQSVDQDGARLVLLAPVVHPADLSERRGFETYPAALRKLAREVGAPLVDPDAALDGLETAALFDAHRQCTPLAHEHTARALAGALRAGDLLRGPARD